MSFSQILQNESALLIDCAVLFAALILARVAPLAPELHPLTWLSKLATQIADKVNRFNRAPSQRQIAGLMACLLIVVPIVAIVAFLLSLAAFPWFFNFLILYLCIPEGQTSAQAKLVYQQLDKGQKPQARDTLSTMVNSHTKSLSEVGICKATIEQQLTSPVYGLLSVIFFYVIGGVPLVLTAKLLRKLELNWPPFHPHFHAFGATVFILNRILFFIPKTLWLLTLSLPFGRLPFKALGDEINQQQADNDFATLQVGANLLNVELGGPQQYLHQKETIRVARAKVNVSQSLPSAASIVEAQKLITPAYYFWLALIVIMPVLWLGLRSLQAM
ncbi:cobalamin biosynthesis protein [Shewanella maritima]|uniref:cobalamin biosynthesis protein CobD/CbiB n=1 Tax=Shewanella maritima TaxID=2520507 RepID=UPI003735AAEC